MLFKINDFEHYWDRAVDLCSDVGIGEPFETASNEYKNYYYNIVIKSDYKDFVKWLYDKNFNVDKEIQFFNKKYLYGRNLREAYYQVFTYEFEEWINQTWDKNK